MKQRKWEYITNKLKKFNAPVKVVSAAQEIDKILVELGLGWNTEAWSAYSAAKHSLFHVVASKKTCTACVQAEECYRCVLGGYVVNERGYYCTPRNKYADNYFGIVTSWTHKHKNEGTYGNNNTSEP